MQNKPLKTFVIYPFTWWIHVLVVICIAAICLLVTIFDDVDVSFLLLMLLLLIVIESILILSSHRCYQCIYDERLEPTYGHDVAYRDIRAIHLVNVPIKIVQKGPWVCIERYDGPFRYIVLPAKDAEGFARCLLEHSPHASYHPDMRPMRRHGVEWDWADTPR